MPQPSNEAELCNAVATAVAIDDQPSCLRFPRGNGVGADFAAYGVSEKLKGTPWQVTTSLSVAPLGSASQYPPTAVPFCSRFGRRGQFVLICVAWRDV